MKKPTFKQITVDKSQKDSAVVKHMESNSGKELPVVDTTPKEDSYRTGKRSFHVAPKKGETMDVCATINNKYRCCNVHVLKSVSNCPFDCSYCFLQNYLNNGVTTVIGDVQAMMDEVREKTESQSWRLFRIGTWELGDSLALENETGQAQQLIHEFTKIPNAVLELKTKSDVVDPILECDHQGKTVVSWSMNPAEIIDTTEHKTAPLEKRLAAIKKVVDAGYLLGFHFDPMILHDHYETSYPDLVRTLAEIAPANQIAWISFGSLRFNPEMKQKMELNFPKSTLTYPEMVLGDDGKMRYVKPLRLKMYKSIYAAIRESWGDDVLVYLCMERWDVWETIMGFSPDSIGHLDYIFAKSLFDRFSQFRLQKPNLDLYS